MMMPMALACQPPLILADEPTTALDVTIQAQILELMKNLSRQFGVAMLMITHNLGVVARYADRVNVMYAGRIIEAATARALYAARRDPATLGLLRSVPRPGEPRRARLGPVGSQPRALPPRSDRRPAPRPHAAPPGVCLCSPLRPSRGPLPERDARPPADRRRGPPGGLLAGGSTRGGGAVTRPGGGALGGPAR